MKARQQGSKILVNDDLNGALRLLKKYMSKEGVTKDIKRIAYYESKSEKKRREAKISARRIRKLAKKNDF